MASSLSAPPGPLLTRFVGKAEAGTPGFRQAAGRGALKARQRLDRIELAQWEFYRFGDRGGQMVAIDRLQEPASQTGRQLVDCKTTSHPACRQALPAPGNGAKRCG